MLMDEVKAVRDGQVPCSTVVIDTADAAERLCIEAICAKNDLESIESPGYGKGYTYVAEEFGRLLDVLSEAVDRGTNVVMVAHAVMRKFERPDESGAYDRFEMKLSKKAAPMVKEWADMVLFLDYDMIDTINKDKKAKASGGRRVIRTTHAPQWDAKNRFGLADELPLAWESISAVVPDMRVAAKPKMAQDSRVAAVASGPALTSTPMPAPTTTTTYDAPDYPARLRPLTDLMAADRVTDAELRHLVGQRGDFTEACPVEEYRQDFIDFIVSHWPSFQRKLRASRLAAEAAAIPDSDIPFDTTEPKEN